MYELKILTEMPSVTHFPETRNNVETRNFTSLPLTLAAGFELSGVGLHTGNVTHVRVLPASASEGRYFVRVDLPGTGAIACHIDAVHQTILSTELANGEAKVRTVEHLLAALAGMGVNHARIEIDGPEVPLLDGSALPWVEEIERVGVVPVEEEGERGREGEGERGRGGDAETRRRGDAETGNNVEARNVEARNVEARNVETRNVEARNVETRNFASLQFPLWVGHEDAFVAALPAEELRFSYAIDFDLPAIGRQWYSWLPSRESFVTEIAPARTFGLAHQIEQLRSSGLIKGGSLENALVCGPDGWLNPPLRFANEPVRHKILDLVGDLSLLGEIPVAHFVAYKASHNLHAKLTRLLSEA